MFVSYCIDSWTPLLVIGGGPPEKVFKIFCVYAYAKENSEQTYHGQHVFENTPRAENMTWNKAQKNSLGLKLISAT